jgi:hypothetical protein
MKILDRVLNWLTFGYREKYLGAEREIAARNKMLIEDFHFEKGATLTRLECENFIAIAKSVTAWMVEYGGPNAGGMSLQLIYPGGKTYPFTLTIERGDKKGILWIHSDLKKAARDLISELDKQAPDFTQRQFEAFEKLQDLLRSLHD